MIFNLNYIRFFQGPIFRSFKLKRNEQMDNSGLIFAIIKDIAIPELAKFIRERYEQTGTWPTKEELDGQVDALANKIITDGEAFLNRPKE